MNVRIVVPRRAGIPDRDRLWEFTQAWWAREFDWPIVEGHHDDGPFNRSTAVNRAARGTWDVAVIIDADVLCDWSAVRQAVEVATSERRMVVAGNRRHHLTREGTEKILAGYRDSWEPFIEITYERHWSSCVVVSRSLWDEVGGFDEQFEGWGFEDDAFKLACETFSAPMHRVDAPIWHLWHDRTPDPALQKANKARAALYCNAAGRPERMRKLRPLPPARIPRILHRSVPEQTSAQVEEWWERFQQMHPGWEFLTHRDPLDPADWPETADLFDRCTSGAQLAGLVRLEALYRHGGVYVDSDVEPYRNLEPLLGLPAFAAWEDRVCVPDAVLGAEAGHPAFREMIGLARARVEAGEGAWKSGPGVTTDVLPGRSDVLLLPPGSFYPYHYTDKREARKRDHRAEQPWSFAAHHWHHSWDGA